MGAFGSSNLIYSTIGDYYRRPAPVWVAPQSFFTRDLIPSAQQGVIPAPENADYQIVVPYRIAFEKGFFASYTGVTNYVSNLAVEQTLFWNGNDSSGAADIRWIYPHGSLVNLNYNVPTLGSHIFRVNGTTAATLGASSLVLAGTLTTGGDLTVPAASKVYVDGGGNTYIYEVAGDDMRVVTGGTERLRLSGGLVAVLNSDLYVPSANKLYLDGGGNTYINESSADTIRLTTGGNTALTVDTSNAVFAGHVKIPASTGRLYLDGGGDTYIHEPIANLLTLVAGGTARLLVDDDATAGNTALVIYDVDNGTAERVSVGAADSAGAGYKQLRIPN